MQYALLPNSRVMRAGNTVLLRDHVGEFVGKASLARLRRRGVTMMRQLDEYGSFAWRFNALRAVKKGEEVWARVRAYEIGEGSVFEVYCDGPRAVEVIERVNAALMPRDKAKHEARKKSRRIDAKRKKRVSGKAQKPKKQKVQHEKKHKLRKRRTASISLLRYEPLFHDVARVSFHDACRAVGMIYRVDNALLLSTKEIVGHAMLMRLSKSMERWLGQNGQSTMFYRNDKFTLLFEHVGSCFDIEHSRFKVWITRNRKHRLHSRARAYFSLLFNEPIGGKLKPAIRSAYREFGPTLLAA